MRRDGFWWHDPAATNKSIKRRVLREIMTRRFGRRTERAPS
jgi:glutamate-1-semialdehyde 2,1-aminomutase